MGGRGASSGISVKLNRYGTEYHTILRSGNIKFVIQTDANSSTTAPMETMTRGRVYVTINHKNNGIAHISYYDNENKRTKTIDFTHLHNGERPHTHHGYNHNENDGLKGSARLTPDERRMIERVEKLWYNHNDKRT